jgi:hypothetical protein
MVNHVLSSICKPEEIVIILNGQDELLGRQSFKIINSKFKNDQSLMMVYSHYFTYNFNYNGYDDIRSSSFS